MTDDRDNDLSPDLAETSGLNDPDEDAADVAAGRDREDYSTETTETNG